MDRNIVYPGSIPLDTDLLALNRNTMVGLGFLAQAVLGGATVVDGLACQPTTPASLSIVIGPGSMTQFAAIDLSAYGSLPADSNDFMLKLGVNIGSSVFSLLGPSSVGQSITYLVEAAFLESDVNPVVLPYYNASNPAQTFNGPANSGTAQNTIRKQSVQIQVKPGAPANTGSQLAPAVDSEWTGLYVVTVDYGQLAITAANIVVLPTAPFLNWKLPMLRPGFGSGVRSFTSSGIFFIPAGVAQVEVEVWGGGAGSYASISGLPSGGGAAGGYARKCIVGLTPGQPVVITVGAGGMGGTTGGSGAGPGGTSSFGSFVSATGGQLNSQATFLLPQNGGTPAGYGWNGDVNFYGSDGQAGMGPVFQGGMGGAAPMGGARNSGTYGNTGYLPGGGASGAGTGANGTTGYNGAAGGGGLVVIRW
ncbi:glycine-rich domain-containing protein [Rhodopila sp.]|uniref:glycine-rich domain-containing protein n=1 Tax=Rhodopila sp. TaxID=2480087 RepID=UPI003D136887